MMLLFFIATCPVLFYIIHLAIIKKYHCNYKTSMIWFAMLGFLFAYTLSIFSGLHGLASAIGYFFVIYLLLQGSVMVIINLIISLFGEKGELYIYSHYPAWRIIEN